MFRRLAALVSALLLPALIVIPSAPAGAITPGVPENLSTSGEKPSDIPTLSWSRVPEATAYQVQVSASSGFGSTLWTTSTVNLHAVPTVQLPNGDLWFRVRAQAGSTFSEWATQSFQREKGAGPALLNPNDGKVLHQPDDPVLLEWDSVPGAKNYVVEISSDQGFTDPALIKTFSTKSTTLVRPDPQVARAYYWRVAGVLGAGITTEWSVTRSYVLSSLPAALLTSPENNATVTITDVVLDWQAVPGATSYDVEVSLVPDFSTLVHSQARVTGTRYSPPATLDNNQYYWRVRARDVLGNVQDGSAATTWTFRRAWPEQPDLQYPADNAVVGDPFYYQWSPVTLASRYELQVSLNRQFDAAGQVKSCRTTQTIWTQVGPCWPDAAGTYYWRVIALDDPKVVRSDEVAAEIFRYSYLPDLVTSVVPESGATVSLPTLRWDPLAGAAQYRVTITNTSNGAATVATTYASSFTPRTKLTTGTYRWFVQSVSEDGRLGPVIQPGAQWTFTVEAAPTATATTPEPTLPHATYGRFPTLTWTPVVGATHYKVLIRPSGNIADFTLTDTFQYPAGEDDGSQFLPAGDYTWRIEAWNGSNYLATSTTPASFTIAERPAVTGQRVALSGTESGDPETSCSQTLPDSCERVWQNPVLRWDPEPNTAYYMLYLAYDRELTNPVGNGDGFPMQFPITVNGTMWTPSEMLPEGDAGTAYFWGVRPCTADGVCRTLEYPVHSFSKLSNRPEPVSPGIRLSDADTTPLPSLPDDITFTWTDYLASNLTADATEASLSSPSRTEARSYRIQVSSDPSFATLLDNAVVDQTTFTSFANTYPDAQIYWRVQVIDGSNRALPWSEKWTFDKQSPVPTLIGPSSADGATFDGSEPLRWQSLRYASSYDVEIYRNGDTKPDAANLVDKGLVAQTAVSWIDPVSAATEAYTWRVRRVDAMGRPGDWSPWMSYKVEAEALQLGGPADDTEVAPNENLFSWHDLAGAASYRWERRAAGSSSTAAVVATMATAYAPTATLPDGSWEWRVVALDTANKVLQTSEWRGFTVVGAPQLTADPQIAGSGQVGSFLTSTAPAWDRDGVTNHYQWLRNGAVIPEANLPTYEVTGPDLGRSLTLRVTGRLPGYRDAVAASNAITGVSGPAPTTATPPSISGSGRVGTALAATPPTWNESGVTMKYQWLRDGAAIGGQTTASYTVVLADVGHDITFRVTGSKPGFADATVASNVIRGVAGNAAVNTAAPAISGTPAVGQTLSATPGQWSGPSPLTYSYQWLRVGAPIAGATSSSYRPVAADAGRQLTVRVAARKTGHADGLAQSAPVSVRKLSTVTSASLKASKIRRGTRGKMVVTVAATGVSAPTGKVAIFKGRKLIATGTLTLTKVGRVAVRLPKLPVGRHRLRATYAGNGQLNGSRSGYVRLTVRR